MKRDACIEISACFRGALLTISDTYVSPNGYGLPEMLCVMSAGNYHDHCRRWCQISAPCLRGLRALQEERLLKRYVVVSLETTPRRIGGIEVLPWRDFLSQLWEGEFA